MTRAEMMARMSAAEFDQWAVFGRLYPLGERGADLRAGMVVATIANANRSPANRDDPITPADVFPWLKDEEPEPTPEETEKRMLLQFAAAGVPIEGAGD